LDDDVIYAPSNDGNLYAIDQNGTLLWAFETGHYIWAQPLISKDAVYMGSMDHFVYAVSKSGQELWRTELAGAVNASPVLNEDGSALFVGSLGKEMNALDTDTGEPIWTFTFDGDLESVWGRALFNEGNLYFADSGGQLYALDASSGDLVWPAPIEYSGSVVGGLTALEDGFVFATEEGDIRAYNFDGTMKWERSVDGEIYQAPAVSGNYLVVGTIDGEDLVYLYDLDGNRIWAETPEN
jgi:outer membrane protein assembly factor BamB